MPAINIVGADRTFQERGGGQRYVNMNATSDEKLLRNVQFFSTRLFLLSFFSLPFRCVSMETTDGPGFGRVVSQALKVTM